MSDFYSGFVRGSYALFGEKMLVSRMQDHMFTTVDGTVHCIVNKGLGQGLVILSSTDGGETFVHSDTIYGSSFQSTSDFVLLADGLTSITTFIADDGQLTLLVQEYDPVAGTWAFRANVPVPAEDLSPFFVNPTLAVAPGGTILVSYAETKLRGTEITLFLTTDMGDTWTETSLMLHGASAGSSCVLATAGVAGAIVATNDVILWLSLNESGQFTSSPISLEGVSGPYASHFSAATQAGNVYLGVSTSEQQLSFFVFDSNTMNWTKMADPISASTNVRWVQTSVAEDGTLYLIHDNASNGRIIVLESTDGGQSWETDSVLILPVFSQDDHYRFEVSEKTVGDMEIMVQVDAGETGNVLYNFVVDVDNNGLQTGGAQDPIYTSVDYFAF